MQFGTLLIARGADFGVAGHEEHSLLRSMQSRVKHALVFLDTSSLERHCQRFLGARCDDAGCQKLLRDDPCSISGMITLFITPTAQDVIKIRLT